MGFKNFIRLRPHATGHDHLAVLRHGFADCGKGFGLCAVKKATGVDDDRICADMAFGKLVSFRAQLGNDALAIHQRFRASQRDEGNFGGMHMGVHLSGGAVGNVVRYSFTVARLSGS